MTKISSSGLRAPAPFEGLNVNFCKNPKCANFGVPETPFRTRLFKGTLPGPSHYGLVATGKGKPALKCALCSEVFPMRSNQAVYEELCRLSAYLLPADEPSCPTEGCPSFKVPHSAAEGAYAQFGKTAAGTPRFQCRHCRKTFSGAGKSTQKQYMAHKNREVFSPSHKQDALTPHG